MGDVFPEISSIDRLTHIAQTYVQSAHKRRHKDPSFSTELPDLTVDLDIYALPDQVCAQVLLHQHPNHFLQSSELSHFDTATNLFDNNCYDEAIALEPST